MKRKLRSVLSDTLPKLTKDTVKRVRETEIPLSASALAYTTILSVVPLIAVFLAALKLFGGFEMLSDIVEPFIFENLAQGSDEKTIAIFRTFVEKTRFGTVGIGGVIGLVLTSASMLGRIEQTVNRIWRTPDRRSWYRRAILYLFFITVGPLALALAIAAATTLDLPLSKVLPSGTPFFFILVGIFYAMYRYLPYRAVYWRAALVASVGTSSVWTIAKILYGIYVRKFVTYDRIYGSLGAVPIFLVWIYVAWLVVLTGAAFSASLQRHYLKGEELPNAKDRKKSQIPPA